MANRFSLKQPGQSLVEYGLTISLIAVACIGALVILGGSLDDMLRNVRTAFMGTNSNTAMAANSPSLDIVQSVSNQSSANNSLNLQDSPTVNACYAKEKCLN